MNGHWQVQEAKQRFSELIRSVQTDGPPFVTRHGEEVAVHQTSSSSAATSCP